MSCTDCFNGCGTPTPDTCVKYTGPSVPLLGIETGDPISKVEAEIIAKLEEFATGAGITLSDIDLKCPYLESLLGCCKDKTLVNLIQMLIDASCNLKELVDSVLASSDSAYVYNLQCITGVPANPSTADVIQAIIDKVCSMNTTVNTIFGDYVKASQLNTLIANYLAGAGTSTQQYTKMVPYVAYEYYGSIAINFTAGGSGNPATGFDKVYLCSGQTVNGFVLPDKRGRVAVGMPSQPGGGPLPAAVDYALPINASCNYTIKQQFGENFNQLITGQLPAHTHTPTVTDGKHFHLVVDSAGQSGTLTAATSASSNHFYGDTRTYVMSAGIGVANVGKSSESTSNITVDIASVGNGNPVDNRQPSVAAYYIMYIP